VTFGRTMFTYSVTWSYHPCHPRLQNLLEMTTASSAGSTGHHRIPKVKGITVVAPFDVNMWW
jgi:hypothetical protein